MSENIYCTHAHTAFLVKDGHVAPPAGKRNKQNESKMQTMLNCRILLNFNTYIGNGGENAFSSINFFKGDKKDKEKPGQCYNAKKL